MKNQEFKITIRLKTQVGVGKDEVPHLTENRVKRQMEKFLSRHHITEGLMCHGTGTFEVTDVIEESAV